MAIKNDDKLITGYIYARYSPPFAEKSNTVTIFFVGGLFGITVKTRKA